MHFFLKYKNALLVAVFMFIFVETLIYVVAYKIKEKDEAVYLQGKSEYFSSDAILAESFLTNMSKIFYISFIKDENISSLVASAYSTTNPKKQAYYRKQLYKKLQIKYQYMRSFGVRQLHFHLAGNISFLRFHRPNKFGDSLVGIRVTIDKVNKTHKEIHGFEEGRIFNGFRNVYPIFYHGKFVGTVEVSYSAQALISQLAKVTKNTTYLMLLKDSVITTKVFDDEKSNYLPSNLKHYMIDKGVFRNLTKWQQEMILNANKYIANSFTLKMQNAEDFSIISKWSNNTQKYLVVSCKNLKNSDGKSVAYMVKYELDSFVGNARKRFEQLVLILSFVNLIFALSIFWVLYKEHEKSLKAENISNHDPLTGLYNRRAFDTLLYEAVATSLRYTHSLSIVFFDIDYFKKVNDKYGHRTGDFVLKHLAQLVANRIRSSDIFARWGGEEFVIVLPNTEIHQAVKLAEKLRVEIEQENFESRFCITCSFGVTYLKEGDDVREIMKRVDTYLYKAKGKGRNCTISDKD